MDILILQGFLEVPCHRSEPKLNNLYKIHPCIWARTESQFIAFELRANPLNPGHVQHALPSSCNHAPTRASTPGRARGAGHEQVPNFRIWCASELHRISDIGLHLVGAWPIPLKNDGVSWDGWKFPIYGDKSHVPNNQPVTFYHEMTKLYIQAIIGAPTALPI